MKQTHIILITLLMFSFCAIKSFSQVTDIDGNEYKTFKIGNQEWLAENLNISHYQKGDSIQTTYE